MMVHCSWCGKKAHSTDLPEGWQETNGIVLCPYCSQKADEEAEKAWEEEQPKRRTRI